MIQFSVLGLWGKNMLAYAIFQRLPGSGLQARNGATLFLAWIHDFGPAADITTPVPLVGCARWLAATRMLLVRNVFRSQLVMLTGEMSKMSRLRGSGAVILCPLALSPRLHEKRGIPYRINIRFLQLM